MVQKKGAIIEAEENFEKQSYRNRCIIYSANGAQVLTVPVKNSSSKTKIQDLKISYQENWQTQHWRALISAYKGRPFFDIVAEDIKAILDSKPTFLVELNEAMIHLILDWIQSDVKISHSKSFTIPENNEVDYRYRIHPKKDSILVDAPPYFQQFSGQHGFIADLSVIDLLFSEGRATWDYLNSVLLK